MFSSGDSSFFLKLKDKLNLIPFKPSIIAAFFGVLSFLIRIPFLFRWDLQFDGDAAVNYLMAVRISRGDNPLYTFGNDYQGSPPFYLAGLLCKWLGPSIPVVSAVSLLAWSLAASLGVYLLTQGTSKFYGIIGGIVVVIGVPYTLHQSTMPFVGYPLAVFWTMLVLLETHLMIEKGVSTLRFFLLGFTIGLGMYLGKQFIPAIPACVLALALFRSRDFKKQPLLRFGLGLMVGYLLGDSPDFYYRWFHRDYLRFSALAPLHMMLDNLHYLFKSIPAYFDAHFYSRAPVSGYFTSPYYIYPRSFMDIFFSAIAALVVLFMGITIFDSFKAENYPMLLMTTTVFFNFLAVVLAQQSHGDFWEPRRYLYVSSIIFSVFLGVFFGRLMEWKGKWIPLLGSLLLVLFLSRVILHGVDLLDFPEQPTITLAKQEIHVMDEWGINRGLGEWGAAYTIDALTNERIIMASRSRAGLPTEMDIIPEYGKMVASSDRIVLLEGDLHRKKTKIFYRGQKFNKSGITRHLDGNQCTPYDRIKQIP